ncbi:MAG: hypothetical protein QGF65_01100 [Candidatus Pelagibacter bacterium]|jgi:hypothetical protein|nr:hypothetical protein [Candidatus Pelagibacter bacterium]
MYEIEVKQNINFNNEKNERPSVESKTNKSKHEYNKRNQSTKKTLRLCNFEWV